MKIVTVVGARPQFIKAAALSRAIGVHNQTAAESIEEIIVHTGQHYDENMSDVFFEQMNIPRPAYRFEVAGRSHGAMTGGMLADIEEVVLKEAPDWLLVYGDTNSTIAGALAAAKLHVPVAHVEAGLRSFNKRMPEEINRILTDHISGLLLCPTDLAVQNLRNEGVVENVLNVGDVMYDVSLFYRDISKEQSDVMSRLGLSDGGYALSTVHRAENTDNPERLSNIVKALSKVAESLPIVLPLHPRTRKYLNDSGLIAQLGERVILVDPLPFLDMVRLEQSAQVIFTDSGGVQKEAYFYNVPCITLRDETEWIETVESGWNTLVGADQQKIVQAFECLNRPNLSSQVYGDGKASEKIVNALVNYGRK
ncbi:MAG: UDP-N-acetylglucosamine 2-epimerase (non-hydrolyzing) [Candidatus Moraniibacteriota bacterium]|nr:MAG: UDP-N-acetylglucosamine 2-epimerase (non-hydrolyzing) [Candidatus Moranbacteria bacterium]